MNATTYIVAFHIGRGGSFNNPGHKIFNPYVDKLSDCYEDCFIESEDFEGNPLPDEQWQLVDVSGRVLLEGREQINSDTGILDWDGEYNTDIVKYLDECTEDEIEILYNHYLTHGYMDDELKDYVCSEVGVNRIRKIKFYKTNAEVFCQECCLTFFWDGGYTVTKEDAAEWMKENNIDPLSIEEYADDFETHYYVSEEDE